MKTITITKEIPAPPDGWEWQDRKPNEGEESIALNYMGDKWTSHHTNWQGVFQVGVLFAYRIRDEYAERYESLKLPDGWAWKNNIRPEYTEWSNDANSPFDIHEHLKETCRRIVNGKAYKIGQEPK